MCFECYSYDYNCMATVIHTDSSGNLFISFHLMVTTNIMTGYTYIPVIIFLQVILGLNVQLPVPKALANPGMAMPLIPINQNINNAKMKHRLLSTAAMPHTYKVFCYDSN